jgi:hypothetical protein
MNNDLGCIIGFSLFCTAYLAAIVILILFDHPWWAALFVALPFCAASTSK